MLAEPRMPPWQQTQGMIAKVVRMSLALVVSLAAVAHAAPLDAPRILAEAQARLDAGDAKGALTLAEPLARRADLTRPDRAQAWRIVGLAELFAAARPEAEAALFEYLKLEPDAHLDPALLPPEAVVFFEDVRTRHAGELSILRPRPRRPWSPAVNLVAPLGQFQNDQPGKGWILGAVEVAALGTNVATYVLLRRACNAGDKTCRYDPDAARRMKTVNVVSGVMFLGAMAYGIVDGWLVHRSRQDARPDAGPALGLVPLPDGAAVFAAMTF